MHRPTFSPPLMNARIGRAERAIAPIIANVSRTVNASICEARLSALALSFAPSARAIAVEAPTPRPAPTSIITQ